MVSEKVAQKAVEFIQRHGIMYAESSHRPWGSYDLVVKLQQKPNHILCRTFGSAYTPEQAVATYFVDFVNDQLPYDQLTTFREYFGATVCDELKFMINLFNEPEKLEAVVENGQESADN